MILVFMHEAPSAECLDVQCSNDGHFLVYTITGADAAVLPGHCRCIKRELSEFQASLKVILDPITTKVSGVSLVMNEGTARLRME